MDPEQTYRVEHIFRPLTVKQIEEYKRQILYMEKQFPLELERFKAAEKNLKSSQKPKREPMSIEFEESERLPPKSATEELF